MPELNVAPLLATLEALAPRLRTYAGEGDALGRQPEPVVHELRALGLFRLWIPRLA